ncbi:MAG TPA: MinD/ParA family protein [Lapillicoccus sp.]|uniref:MinD/ParA family ATP-binding protein n=1 Tax=Lapillicoccus sp. TaxID=1909287 RepID=UPI002F93E058
MTNPTLLAPTLAPGVSLLGEYQGSGFTEPHYLIVRADQQVLHVSRLLFVVASHLDGRSSMEEIAGRVSQEYGRTLDAEGVQFLVTAKLRPMGIAAEAVADDTGEHVSFGLPLATAPARPRPAPEAREPRPAPEPPGAPLPAPPAPTAPPARLLPRANPLLALRFRGTLIPASATRFLARLLAPFFYGPVVVIGIVGLVVADVWLLRQASLTGAVDSILVDPPMLLSVIGILLGATVVHELGHAAACRYGGATPGKIGVAVYIVYPAFFTDVTQSYRLGRAGRVRTDLGGVYFNALTIAGLTAVYAHTQSPAVLLAIVFVHVEALQQLLPLGRLDGYFVVADLVGVPDLFGRIGPILRSALPGRQAHPKVAELRRSARVVVTLWVVVTGPIMVGILGFMLWNAPAITAQVVDAMSREWTLLQASIDARDVAGITLAALSLILLPLPLLGLAWLVGGILRRIVAAAVRPLRRHRTRPSNVGTPYRLQPEEIPMSGSDPTTHPTAMAESVMPYVSVVAASAPGPVSAPVVTRTADELTERFLLRAQPRTPRHGWRRGVFAVTGGHVNPGPSNRERREDALLERVRTRIDGSRRIVVLSRKGGAGKTTTTLMLGHTFATHRGDRVVALDANPDAGSLGMRLPRETQYSATDLLAERTWVERYSQIRAFTSQDPVSRLEVVASDDDPRITLALGSQDYRHLVDTLDRHYNLVLVDTGTGILDDAIQGILEEADQLVVVMPPALDGGRVAAMTLDWLDQHGHHDLVANAVAVVNAVRGSGPLELDRLEEHFASRCASVHRIPWDPVLEAGAHSALADLRPETRAAYLELAGAVAEGFRSSGHTPTREQP